LPVGSRLDNRLGLPQGVFIIIPVAVIHLMQLETCLQRRRGGAIFKSWTRTSQMVWTLRNSLRLGVALYVHITRLHNILYKTQSAGTIILVRSTCITANRTNVEPAWGSY